LGFPLPILSAAGKLGARDTLSSFSELKGVVLVSMVFVMVMARRNPAKISLLWHIVKGGILKHEH